MQKECSAFTPGELLLSQEGAGLSAAVAGCQGWLVPAEAPTFLQGLEDTSKDALNARLCCVVSIVLGRLGLLGSFPSSLPFPWVTWPLVGLTSPSSSSLLTGEKRIYNCTCSTKKTGCLRTALQSTVSTIVPWLFEYLKQLWAGRHSLSSVCSD